jgi:hypothetical protein
MSVPYKITKNLILNYLIIKTSLAKPYLARILHFSCTHRLCILQTSASSLVLKLLRIIHLLFHINRFINSIMLSINQLNPFNSPGSHNTRNIPEKSSDTLNQSNSSIHPCHNGCNPPTNNPLNVHVIFLKKIIRDSLTRFFNPQ